jgi:hypothetical protein
MISPQVCPALLQQSLFGAHAPESQISQSPQSLSSQHSVQKLVSPAMQHFSPSQQSISASAQATDCGTQSQVPLATQLSWQHS